MPYKTPEKVRARNREYQKTHAKRLYEQKKVIAIKNGPKNQSMKLQKRLTLSD